MKAIVISIVLSFCFIAGYAQENDKNQTGTKENPVEIKKAKNQVSVVLTKEVDAEGNVKVITTETKVIIPESFPKYIDTGDPKQDEANYYEAKQKWIRENPEEFEKIKHLNL